MNDHIGKEIARRGAEHVLEALGIAGAIAAISGAPIAGAAIGATTTVGIAACKYFENRRNDRRDERSKRLVENLQVRLAKVESRPIDDDEVDLFAEMYMRAVEDDDSRKIVFHGAFIAWMAKEKRRPCDARLFGDAVARLTYEELRGFVMWGRNGGGFRTEIYLQGTSLTDNVVYQRLDPTGLLKQDGVRGTQFFSEIGKALVDECKHDEL